MGLGLFILFIILQVFWHYRIIHILQREPNHLTHAVLRFIVAVLIMYFYKELSIINLLIYGVVFWFLFDSLLNLVRGKKVYYLGTKSILDRFQKEHPNEFVWFVWKLILFIGLTGAYYFN